jgi:hypothetical protein
MRDPELHRLVDALDATFEWALEHRRAEELAAALDAAQSRLRCLERLGVRAEASPYLAFLRRLCGERVAQPRAAAGA